MARRNPLEQLEAARSALQRAQARQRQADTRARVILGGYLLAWMRDDHRVRQALAARLSERPLRPQDADALAPLLDSLAAPQVATAVQVQHAQQDAGTDQMG